MLGVVVPVIAEGIELALEFVGDRRDEGVVGVGKGVFGAEEGTSFGEEEIVKFAPDSGCDEGLVGHYVMTRNKLVFYEGDEGGSWVGVTCVVWWGSYVCKSGE